MFQLIHLYATAPRLDTGAAHGELERFASMLEQKGRSPESNFSDTVGATMAQYNPRGMSPSAKQLRSVDLDRAFSYYKDRFSHASDFTYYFVGSFDTNTIKPFVESYIGSLPASSGAEQWKDLGIRPPK